MGHDALRAPPLSSEGKRPPPAVGMVLSAKRGGANVTPRNSLRARDSYSCNVTLCTVHQWTANEEYDRLRKL